MNMDIAALKALIQARTAAASPPAVSSQAAIPTPGTPAYWTAQREAVALVAAWEDTAFHDDPLRAELDVLRHIAAHGFASRMMAALGHSVARWIRRNELVLKEQEQDEH